VDGQSALFPSLDLVKCPDYNTFMEKIQSSPLEGSLIFLKIGGSLITDKQSPRSARREVIDRIAVEISRALNANARLKLVLGHGSGSFGHFSGKKYRTLEGVQTPEDWKGFAEVWHDASSLNRIVHESLLKEELPAVTFAPSAAVLAEDRKIVSWNLKPIQSALENGLLPVVYGDVVFDSSRGGTILSTEDLFIHLAEYFKPGRILLAGRDPGVWKDYPECTSLIKEISAADENSLLGSIQPSDATDVTGGMKKKVEQMLHLNRKFPDLETVIFSGEEAGNIQ
jgi:isopentenyl phosphate kinase